MSWDGYIDNMVASGKETISKGCIIGLNGSVWTPSGTGVVLPISAPEAKKIADSMAPKNETVGGVLAASGITIGGTKYMFLRDFDGDGRIISCKKVGVGNLVLQSTIQAIIIAFIPEDKSSGFGVANKAVDDIAKYLEGTGY